MLVDYVLRIQASCASSRASCAARASIAPWPRTCAPPRGPASRPRPRRPSVHRPRARCPSPGHAGRAVALRPAAPAAEQSCVWTEIALRVDCVLDNQGRPARVSRHIVPCIVGGPNAEALVPVVPPNASESLPHPLRWWCCHMHNARRATCGKPTTNIRVTTSASQRQAPRPRGRPPPPIPTRPGRRPPCST